MEIRCQSIYRFVRRIQGRRLYSSVRVSYFIYIYIFPDIELDLDQPCGKHHVAKKVIKTDTNIRESSRGTHSHCYIRCVHRGRLVSRVSAMQPTPRTARILSYVFFNHFTVRHAREYIYIYICNESEEPISKFSPRRRTKGERKKKKKEKTCSLYFH